MKQSMQSFSTYTYICRDMTVYQLPVPVLISDELQNFQTGFSQPDFNGVASTTVHCSHNWRGHVFHNWFIICIFTGDYYLAHISCTFIRPHPHVFDFDEVARSAVWILLQNITSSSLNWFHSNFTQTVHSNFIQTSLEVVQKRGWPWMTINLRKSASPNLTLLVVDFWLLFKVTEIKLCISVLGQYLYIYWVYG